MTSRTFIIFLLLFLTSCKDNEEKTTTEIFQIDGDTVTARATEIPNVPGDNYHLTDLTPELEKQIEENLKQAEHLIIKYSGRLPPSKYDANNLDIVFEKWKESNDPKKEAIEYIVGALGAALGQDIVNSLDCEWQFLTDEYGSDITVIHRKYNVNGFPFSSVQKAYSQNKVGAFKGIKLAIKYQIQKAEKSGKVQERQ